MRYRCSKPYRPEYSRYGGRGISVCKEWNNLENGFSNFVSWAMSNGYSDELTLDRINNDGETADFFIDIAYICCKIEGI